MSHTLFIADLHLDERQADTAALFLKFLKQPLLKQADALYILGDLFEAWVGDDDDLPFHQTIKTALAQTTDKGIPLYLLHGNRDFLLGQAFCRQTGCVLLADSVAIDLYGEKTVLMHGDRLCTQDIAYLSMRQQMRNPLWQQQFLAKPLYQRRQIAQQLRQQSQSAVEQKSAAIMDASPSAVEQVLRQHQARCLIHGHIHRLAQHDFVWAGQACQRWVLGDWGKTASVLYCNEKNKQFQTIA
jgi:UDP-2,3-diacylglucosamine hydrolase